MDIRFSPEERRMITEMQSGINDGKLQLNDYSSLSPSIFDAVNKPENYDFEPEAIFNQYQQDIDPTNAKQDNEIGSFMQGEIGDCWLLSGLNAAKDKDPSLLEDVIKQEEKNTFSVKFPGEKEAVSVSEKELQSETQYSKGDKDVRILELAANKVFDKKGKDFEEGAGGAKEFQKLFYPGKKTTQVDPKISQEEKREHKEDLQFLKDIDADTKDLQAELKKNPNNQKLVKELQACKEERKFWAERIDEYNFSASLKDPAGYVKSAVADQNKIVTLSFKQNVKGLDIVPQHAYSIDKNGFLVNPYDTNKKTKIHFNSVLSNPVVSFGIIER